jgi:hypothetical protein
MTNGLYEQKPELREKPAPPIERARPTSVSVLEALGDLHPVTAGMVVVAVTGLTAGAIVGVVALVLSVLTAAVAVAGAMAVAMVAAAVLAVVMSR